MITKDGRDTPIEKLTPDNYVVPKGEEKDYHAIIEVVQYDPKTGRKISRPRVQKFGRKAFEQTVQASLKKQGYTITILHDPTQWLAEQKEKAAKAKAEQAAAKAKADQERFDAAVEAKVKEVIASMQAEAEAKDRAEREAYAKAEAAAKAEAEAKAKAESEANADNAEQADPEPKKPGRPAKKETTD